MGGKKIIKKSCVISPQEVRSLNGELHIINKVLATVEEALELAEKLKFSKNSFYYETFDLKFTDGTRINKKINNLKEMLSVLLSENICGEYSYIIDENQTKSDKNI